MKRIAPIRPQTALRNIESSMRAEGFHVSDATKAACTEVLHSGKNASTLADHHVRQILKQAK